MEHDHRRACGDTPTATLIHSRGYLPHWDAAGRPQFITFCLASSPMALRFSKSCSPPSAPRDTEAMLMHLPCEPRAGRRPDQWLAEPAIAEVVESAVRRWDGDRYQLHAWCVMPDHVHVVLATTVKVRVGRILQAWKSFTAKRCNEILGRDGRFWHPEYFDRVVRSGLLPTAIDYVERNPVVAGLAASPELWRFSSAWWRGQGASVPPEV
jgi:putative DNA methylase